jgi:riboflavin synthase
MFTGIISSIGKINRLDENELSIETSNTNFKNLNIGTSIAVDGCCLTLISENENLISFQISEETLNRTSINKNHCGYVNLELPLTPNSLMSGHIVQGHIDSTTKILDIVEHSNETWTFKFENTNSNYIVDKGSITLNGISLTIVNPSNNEFSVAVINETFKKTNLQYLKIHDVVNVEYDIIIKYLEKLQNDN